LDSTSKEGCDSVRKEPSVTDWNIVGNPSSVQSSKPVLDGIELHEDEGGEERDLVRVGSFDQKCSSRSLLVEKCFERESPQVTNSACQSGGHVDGCFPFGLGSTDTVDEFQQSDMRIIGTRCVAERVDIKQAGIGGSTESNRIFFKDTTNVSLETLADSFGQQYDGVQYQPVRFCEKSGAPDAKIDELCASPLRLNKSSSCERSGERDSGQSVEVESIRRLCADRRGVSEYTKYSRCDDNSRLVREQDEQEAPSLLFGCSEGPQQISSGCVQHHVGEFGNTTSTSPDSSTFKVPEEDQTGTNMCSGGSTLLARSTVDEQFENDDTEDSDVGSVVLGVNIRQTDGEKWGQTPPRKIGGIPSGRINDEGEKMVLDLLSNVGMRDIADWFLGSIAPTTLRNYRRGYTLFGKLLKESGVAISSINSSTAAVSVFVRVLRLAFQSQIKLAAISNMRTAMIRVFSFMFNVDLSQSVVFRMAMRFYTLKNLPKKESLNLRWSVDQLLNYIKGLPSFGVMDFNQLTEVTVVLCLAFTTLRFTEILALNLFESDPDLQAGTWKLWVHVKGHDCLETVVIHSVKEGVPDPVAALVEMKMRI
jgi:hypothetical protein